MNNEAPLYDHFVAHAVNHRHQSPLFTLFPQFPPNLRNRTFPSQKLGSSENDVRSGVNDCSEFKISSN